jgi:hypothetical protein
MTIVIFALISAFRFDDKKMSLISTWSLGKLVNSVVNKYLSHCAACIPFNGEDLPQRISRALTGPWRRSGLGNDRDLKTLDLEILESSKNQELAVLFLPRKIKYASRSRWKVSNWIDIFKFSCYLIQIGSRQLILISGQRGLIVETSETPDPVSRVRIPIVFDLRFEYLFVLTD